MLEGVELLGFVLHLPHLASVNWGRYNCHMHDLRCQWASRFLAARPELQVGSGREVVRCSCQLVYTYAYSATICLQYRIFQTWDALPNLIRCHCFSWWRATECCCFPGREWWYWRWRYLFPLCDGDTWRCNGDLRQLCISGWLTPEQLPYWAERGYWKMGDLGKAPGDLALEKGVERGRDTQMNKVGSTQKRSEN